MVLVTTPAQPASKARRMLLSDSVGGAEERRNGFSKRIPVKTTERSMGMTAPAACGVMLKHTPRPGGGQTASLGETKRSNRSCDLTWHEFGGKHLAANRGGPQGISRAEPSRHPFAHPRERAAGRRDRQSLQYHS